MPGFRSALDFDRASGSSFSLRSAFLQALDWCSGQCAVKCCARQFRAQDGPRRPGSRRIALSHDCLRLYLCRCRRFNRCRDLAVADLHRRDDLLSLIGGVVVLLPRYALFRR